MAQPWTLALPASRGLGAAFAVHLLATTQAPVVATARRDLSQVRARILDAVPRDQADSAAERLEVVEADVTDDASLQAAAEHCARRFPSQTHHLRLACVAPGVLFPEKSPAAIDAADALEALRINLLGPMLVAKHFVRLLPRRATAMQSANADADTAGQGLPATAILALLSARVGSISDNRAGGWYSYRCSKAGVTQLAKTLDLHLRAQSGDNAMAVALHPGTVRTDLSKAFWASEGDRANGGRGLFAPATAAQQLVDVLRGLQVASDRGRCWDWKGEPVPP